MVCVQKNRFVDAGLDACCHQVVAAEAVKQFRPGANIISHHGNVKVRSSCVTTAKGRKMLGEWKHQGFRCLYESLIFDDKIEAHRITYYLTYLHNL